MVLYIVDDLAFGDTAMATPKLASRHRSSPVMDTLARTGVAFTNATAMPNCAPTRAAMLTGTQPTNPLNQIYTVLSLGLYPTDPLATAPRQGLGEDQKRALPEQATTYAEVLRNQGYATGTVGKFHASDTAEHIRTWHGFDYSKGGSSSGSAKQYHAKQTPTGLTFQSGVGPELNEYAADYTETYVRKNVAPFSSGVTSRTLAKLVGTRKHVSDAVADAGIDFIAQAASAKKPFMLNVGSYSVHQPIGPKQARKDLRSKYKVPSGKRGKNSRPAYDAIVEGTDQALGRLLHKLNTTADPARRGRTLADNTIVFVTSDNGGDTRYGGDPLNFRDRKSTLWEGGVRVPWVAWSKNKTLVPAGQTRSQEITAQDFYPTLLEATGSRIPNASAIEGVSWWKAVHRPGYLPRTHTQPARFGRVIHFPGYVNYTKQRPATTLRNGNWKVFYRHETASWELYNLKRDPGERRNVAATYPAITQRYAAAMLRWFERNHAPLVTLGPGAQSLRWASFTGQMYAGGRVESRRDATVIVRPGQPIPVLLPSNPRQVGAARKGNLRFEDGNSYRNMWGTIPELSPFKADTGSSGS